MPPKQRQMRVESKSALAAMQKLESRSDEELEAETRYRAAAQALLGAREGDEVRVTLPNGRQRVLTVLAVSTLV